MNSTQSSLLWFVSRGSGMVAYLLLTAAVVLGIAVSRRWSNAAWPRLVVEGAHRWFVLVFSLFLVVHIATLLLDPFSHISLSDAFVPFGGAYRPFWLGLGVVAAELVAAIAASVLVRRWIGYRVWHALHLLTYLLFPLSLLHGLGTGSDTGTFWTTLMYALSCVAVVVALAWRLRAARAHQAADRGASRNRNGGDRISASLMLQALRGYPGGAERLGGAVDAD